MVGGYVAPLLVAAGWRPVLVCRNQEVLQAVNECGGLWLRIVGKRTKDHWVGGVAVIPPGEGSLPKLAAEAELVATAVGPTSLGEVGRMLAPLLRHRI